MRFWVLGKPGRPSPAEWDESVHTERLSCPKDSGHRRSGRRIGDLRIILADCKPTDFVWTWYSDLLIGEKALEILTKAEITGFVTRPAATRYRNGEKTQETIREVVVTGWAGMARPESGIHFDAEQSCAACGMLRYTGLKHSEKLIDEDQWDGSDIFIVWPLPAFPIVTQRFMDIVREHNLTGLKCLPVEQLPPIEALGPGRLSYSMPEERARLLGEPLGIE